MTLDWIKEEKSDGALGQFSFRIPAAPLYPTGPTQPFIRAVNDVRVRVQTQNRILFEGVVEQARFNYALAWLRSLPRNVFNLDPMQYVAVGVGPRVDWSGNLTQAQIDGLLISCLKGGACPPAQLPCPPGAVRVGNQCVPTRRSRLRNYFPASDTAGLPNTLCDVAAGVSVGGGLLGLAVLALAGYGVYQLVK